MLKLFPLSYEELKNAVLLTESVNAQIFTGGYTRIFSSNIQPQQFYKDYIELDAERDIRQLKNIGNLDTFARFIKLCTGRIGQLLNIQNLADDCGIGATTAKSLLSILETCFIIYFLQPDYRNFSKRLVKSPKLYFCDTGLVCSLLAIQNESQLATHYLRGSLFENLVINRFKTNAFNDGKKPELTFWRDKNGVEIDLLSKNSDSIKDNILDWEIKSGATYSEDYFKNLKHWSAFSDGPAQNCNVIYTG